MSLKIQVATTIQPQNLSDPSLKRKIEDIGDDSVPLEERMRNIADAIGSAFKYAEYNEDRANIHSKKIKNLKEDNEKLLKSISDLGEQAEKLAKDQQDMKDRIEEEKILKEKAEILESNRCLNEFGSHLFGGGSGFSGSIIAGLATLNPLIMISTGVVVGIVGQKLVYSGASLKHYEKYENEFFRRNPTATKRAAFEYAKEKVEEDFNNKSYSD